MPRLSRLLRTTSQWLLRILLALARTLIRSAWSIVITLMLILGGLLWLDSDSGHRWLASQAVRIPGVKLIGIGGSLLRDPTLIGFSYEDVDYHITADHIALSWQLRPLLNGELLLDRMQTGRLAVTIKPTPPDRPPTPAPTDLTLPFSVRIDALEIAELALKNPDLSLQNLRLTFRSDGRHHQIEQLQLQRAGLHLDGTLQLDGKAPFASNGKLHLADTLASRPFEMTMEIGGPLRNLRLKAQGSGAAANTHADLLLDVFAPYAYQTLRAGEARLDEFNPAEWSKDWPQAKLGLKLQLRGTGKDQAEGRLELTNRYPGALNAGQVPLTGLDSRFAIQGEALWLKTLAARLADKGTLNGAGRLANGKIDLDLKLAGIDLSRLWQGQERSLLAGALSLHGPWRAPDIKADLNEAEHALRLVADLGWINPKTERRLAIRRAKLSHGDKQIAAQGEFGLQSPYVFQLSSHFTGLNPAEFLPVPAGSLNGHLDASGHLQAEPRIILDYQLQDSRFNQQALAGAGTVRLENGQRLAESTLWLRLGHNRIDLHGRFGQAGDTLQATLDLPNLSELGPQFTGKISGQLSLSGTPGQATLSGNAALTDLGLPGNIAIKSGNIQASIPRSADAPLQLALTAEAIQIATNRINQLKLEVHGDQHRHDIHAQLNGLLAGKPLAVDTQLTGSLLSDWQWQGRLTELSSQGSIQAQLLEPVALQWSKDEFSAHAGVIALESARIQLDRFDWQHGSVETRGQLHDLALANVLRWAGRDDFLSDLIFNGQWNLRWDGALDGDIALERKSGSSIWRNGSAHEPLAITTAQAGIHAHRNWIEFEGALKSSRFGSVQFNGNTVADPARFALAPGAGITVRSEGELPDLSAFSGLASPSLQLAGHASFKLQRNGTPDSPRVSGTVSGDDLLLRDATSGLYLRDGTVRLALANDSITLEQAVFHSGEGEIRARGTMAYRGEDSEATAHVVANKLTLFSSSDLLLIISGEGEISLRKGLINVSGQIKADQGEIFYRELDTPSLADDVVIVGKPQQTPLRPPRMTLQVDVDLGKDFRFRGYGVDAQLTGLLRLRAQPSRPLTANGQVEVQEGKYRAYGQRLDIERGILSFQGPIDNPGLDILAMRRDLQVEAGVLVRGTALNPRTQLYSEPTVPDTEKLSWMLFGHSTENMEGSDAAIMLAAAQTLLSDGQGGVSDVLAKVGIDDLSVRSVRETDGTPTRIITVSSRLGRHFRISVEKSVNGLRDAVSLSYQVGKSWSLVTKVSQEQESLTASYTHYFE